MTVQMMREQELSPGPGEIRDPPDPLKRFLKGGYPIICKFAVIKRCFRLSDMF